MQIVSFANAEIAFVSKIVTSEKRDGHILASYDFA